MIKLLSTPIRKLLRFPLFQFGIVIFLILVMQAASEQTVLGEAFNALDKIVDSSVGAASAIFTVRSFTKSWLTFGFMIGYVYLACWLIFSLARIAIRFLVDFIGRKNHLLATKRNRARAWHRRISRVASPGENPADQGFAACVGGNLCLA